MMVGVIFSFAGMVAADEIDWQERALKAELELSAAKAQLSNCQAQAQMCLDYVKSNYDERLNSAVEAPKKAYADYLKAKQAKVRADEEKAKGEAYSLPGDGDPAEVGAE
jgi:hypothetical protein